MFWNFYYTMFSEFNKSNYRLFFFNRLELMFDKYQTEYTILSKKLA